MARLCELAIIIMSTLAENIQNAFPPNLRWRHVVQIAGLYGFKRHQVLTLSAGLSKHYFVRGRKLTTPPPGMELRAHYDRDSVVKMFAPSDEAP